MKKVKLLMVGLILSSILMAQKTQEIATAIQNSPAGNFIFLQKGNNSTLDNATYPVFKSIKGENKFTEIGKLSTVKNYAEFKNLVGESFASEFKNQIKAKTDEEVIAYLNKPRTLKDYGLFIMDINFLRAIGLVYLDPAPPEKAFQFEYKVTDPEGKILYQQTPRPFDKNSIPKPLVKKIFTTDSVVSIRWEFPSFNATMPLLARIYRQDDGKGKFMLYPQKASVIHNDNKVYVMHEEQMTPGHLANYYIVPVDMLGNEGTPSDTATTITIDFRKVAGLQNITVTDTLGGLLSQWRPLPEKPYYTGIQILRSREAMKDFIVLDTLSATATSYLDKRVLPNMTYFYKFRPLVYKLSGWQEVIATTVHGSTSSTKNPPLPPKNLFAINEGSNIRLSWGHNMELDIFAYYVLRGTSAKNMEIVSPAIMDTTWLDSTSNLSGRTNYIYTVLAMNNNQLKSELSNSTGIRPVRGGFVETPAGISLHAEGKKVVLTWTDIRKNDAAIAGYILYRKKSTDKDFTPVKNSLIPVPSYEDAEVESNSDYIYRVSAVDRFGYESGQSPYSKISLIEKIMPPSQVFARKLSAGIEISWPQNNEGGIISYTIYRKLPEDKVYTKIGTAKPESGLFTDKNFIPNKLNIYTVAISTKNGESEKSVEKSIFAEK